MDDWAALVVLGVGAGVYEELIFRLIGFALLHALLVDLLALRPAAALVITIAVTSVAFALYHHAGGGEPFTWVAMLFRTAAGVWLGLIFAARGFGLAAGAHAAYDVLLVTLLCAAGRI
jgi:membrane protease YdiL (CAAX protease family)